MIEFAGRGFQPFLGALMLFRRNGVVVSPRGANRGTVPDDTDWALVQQVAAMDGVTVWTDLPEPAPTQPVLDEPPPAPVKKTTRRTKKET